jgi:uncharacterized damage-inducible protein DinB
MSDIGAAFIKQSRYHLSEDFLPKIERCLSLLDDKHIWWRANAESNSIGNLLLHLSGNVRQWIVCGLGAGKDARHRDSEFAQTELIPRAELLAHLKQTLREVDDTLAKFDPGKLLEPKRIQGLDVTALDAVLHVVEHFSMHTGQILYITKQLTAHDLHFYDL